MSYWEKIKIIRNLNEEHSNSTTEHNHGRNSLNNQRRETERIGKRFSGNTKSKLFSKEFAKISQFLYSFKIHWNGRYKGIYSVPCSCGLANIGETTSSVKTCLSEHENYLKPGLFSKLAVAKH